MRKRETGENEQKGLTNKQKILDTVTKLFYEDGYDRTSMRKIARECGFKPSNFYNYFSTKENILYEIMLARMKSLMILFKPLEKPKNSMATDRLRSFVRLYTNFTLLHGVTKPRLLFETEMKHLSAAHRKRILDYRDKVGDVLCRIIQEGIESGEFYKVDVKVYANLITSMIVRSQLWFSPKGRLSYDELADIIFNLVVDGMKNRQ
jgi:AcrR family transcriptional regulator